MTPPTKSEIWAFKEAHREQGMTLEEAGRLLTVKAIRQALDSASSPAEVAAINIQIYELWLKGFRF